MVAVHVEPDIDYVNEEEGREIFEDLTRDLFGMTADEFVRQYHAGTLGDRDDIDIARAVMMMPLFGDVSRAGIDS